MVTESEYEAATAGCGLVDRSERGKLALTGADAKSFLQGQVSNDVESLTAGSGCYAAFLTPKGKMLGDLRILDTGSELLLDTERVALQELFNMIRRFSIGYDVELHKRTRAARPAVAARPPRRRRSRQSTGSPRSSTRTWRLRSPGSRSARSGPIWGSTSSVTPSDTEALIAALQRAGAVPRVRGGGRLRPDRARASALRNRPRRLRDPPGGRASTSARCRSPRAATSARRRSRGCTTAASPTASCEGCGCRAWPRPATEITLDGRAVGRLGSVAQSPTLGPVALALVRREAPPGSRVTVGVDEVGALVVELPFAR